MTKEFEWLLESEGWKKSGVLWVDGNKPKLGYYPAELQTYEFISKIKIKDWEKYDIALANILIERHDLKIIWNVENRRATVGEYLEIGEFRELLHNASLDDRILALVRERGYEG